GGHRSASHARQRRRGAADSPHSLRRQFTRLVSIHPQGEPEEQWVSASGGRNRNARAGSGTSEAQTPGSDEILLIQGGTAHVWLGDQERDLHAGGLVFIP